MKFRWSYRIAAAWGIPIKLHVSLLLILPFLQWDLSFGPAILLTAGVFTTIVLHELGHAYVAIRKGAFVREILILPIGGVARIEGIPRRPRDEFLMAAAGPAVSLALFAVLFFGGRLFPVRLEQILDATGTSPLPPLSASGKAGMVLQALGLTNLGWVFFNLIPAFPMDGGRILRAALAHRYGRLRATFVASLVGKVLALALGVAAIRHGLVTLGLIAAFVYFAAGQEYRIVRFQESWERWGFGPPRPRREPEADRVVIGPPPYAPHEKASAAVVRRGAGPTSDAPTRED